ncbi:MAG: hypothetical protein ABL967_20845, partial [Bryobacteraceae bacterium]
MKLRIVGLAGVVAGCMAVASSAAAVDGVSLELGAGDATDMGRVGLQWNWGRQWFKGDQGQPTPPESRRQGRNRDWPHLFNRDVISMPDKWEYPWYAAWDLAFHMIPFAQIDGEFAKQQLLLFLREWYM